MKPVRWGRAGRLACVGALICGFSAIAVEPVRAQRLDQLSRAYITPFPQGDRYRLAVFGDSLGDGISSGLYQAFRSDGNVDVVKHSRHSTGFVRVDYYDWNARLRDILRSEKVHIAVVIAGVSDMQSILAKRQYHKVGTEVWREVYGSRIDRFLKRLKKSRAAVYWVGLPIMRGQQRNQSMQVMNEIFREKAFLNGVKFIDTFNGFADQFGRYSAYGPDLQGQIRRLRAQDGIHFTPRGYRKLAHFVEREIRRDLRAAKAERNIPLAGNEAEQARAVGRGRSSEQRGRPGGVAGKPLERARAKSATLEGEKRRPKTAEQRADELRSARNTVDGIALVRPKITDAATVSSGYAPQGETIASEMGDGLTALASISPINDPNLSTARRQLPLSQRPYYRVLIKGEQVRPKAGRADDFSWPRS